MVNGHKQSPLVPQRFSSLESFKIQNLFLLKTREYDMKPSEILVVKNVKNVQINHQTTEIWPKELNVL